MSLIIPEHVLTNYDGPERWLHAPRDDQYPLVYVPAPTLEFMGDLFPRVAVQADLERYRERFPRLLPFSKREREYSADETFAYVDNVSKSRRYPGPQKAHIIHARVKQINQFLDDNDAKLAVLKTVYSPESAVIAQPMDIREGATEVLADVIEAQQSYVLGDWTQSQEDTDAREENRGNIWQHLADLDDNVLAFQCASSAELLKDRQDFWAIELATVLSHPATVEVDRYMLEREARAA